MPAVTAALVEMTAPMPVQLVTVGFSEETTRTLEQVQAAMKAHPLEALDLTLNTPEGQPFPYRPWFGVSREAYERARAAQPELFPAGASTLTVQKRGTGGTLLVLRGGAGLEVLNGLQLNMVANTLRTPWGTTEGKAISVSDEGGMGPRAGMTWKIEQAEEFLTGNATSVTFTMMQLTKHDRILVNYKVRIMRAYEIEQEEDVSFLLPAQ
ncbi:hypothetical protein V3W47_15605 [Deinococcus sp. YIM 134068]|uniref:hypothetical protein n=1 Tax=Deinococcus lichenicola TaxID=3118910 RepID=UPI002F91FEC1